MSDPDISREACEEAERILSANCLGEIGVMILALRAALDAAIQEINDDNVKMNEWRDRTLAADAAAALAEVVRRARMAARGGIR